MHIVTVEVHSDDAQFFLVSRGGGPRAQATVS